MRFYVDPCKADGRTQDLRDIAVTMWHGEGRCKCGAGPLTESSHRVYCRSCGVWWWSDKAKGNEDAD